MDATVNIWFTGDDPDDVAFAEGIATSAAAFCRPRLLDVDELTREDSRGKRRLQGFRGVGVFVISPRMISVEPYRSGLPISDRALGVPGHKALYICRGISVSDVQSRCPDLENLFDKVTVGEEEDLPLLLDELNRHVTAGPKTWHGNLIAVVSGLLSIPIQFLANLLYPVWLISQIAPLVVVHLLMVGGRGPAFLVPASVLLCAFGAGWSLNRLPAMDFWPWLGRRWKVPPPAERMALSRSGVSPGVSREWKERGLVSLPQHQEQHSYCSAEEFLCARIWWSEHLRGARLWSTTRFVVFAGSAVLLMKLHASHLMYAMFAAAAVGFAFPILHYWASDRIRGLAYWNLGLTPRELDRTQDHFDPVRTWQDRALHLPNGVPTERRQRWESQRTLRWVGGHVWSTSHTRRQWLRRRPYAFVTYAWADPSDVAKAREVADALVKEGVSAFLDRREIDKFAAYRSQISRGLLRSTHEIVIIGPATPHGRITLREIRTALQRWHTELLPTVICVVDADVAAALLADVDTPFELRFILQCCPRLSFQEARDARLVARLVRATQRQGLLRDWLTASMPRLAFRRMCSALISVNERTEV